MLREQLIFFIVYVCECIYFAVDWLISLCVCLVIYVLYFFIFIDFNVLLSFYLLIRLLIWKFQCIFSKTGNIILNFFKNTKTICIIIWSWDLKMYPRKKDIHLKSNTKWYYKFRKSDICTELPRNYLYIYFLGSYWSLNIFWKKNWWYTCI